MPNDSSKCECNVDSGERVKLSIEAKTKRVQVKKEACKSRMRPAKCERGCQTWPRVRMRNEAIEEQMALPKGARKNRV